MMNDNIEFWLFAWIGFSTFGLLAFLEWLLK